MKFSATVSTPALATAVGPSRSISPGLRRSSTSFRPTSSTSRDRSFGVTLRRAALRSRNPRRVCPPPRTGRPPTSRTLSMPSKVSQRSREVSTIPPYVSAGEFLHSCAGDRQRVRQAGGLPLGRDEREVHHHLV